MKKTALIIGVCGQAGSYLAEFLLEKDYRVVGVMRRNATADLGNATHLENDIEIVEGDITDFSSILKIIQLTRPQELYSLAAQSHVKTSFDQPIASVNINLLGVVNILESVKTLGYSTRIAQASTSELWGATAPPHNEDSYMAPRSPYAIAKLGAHWFVKMYREAYGMYACNAIIHNYESPRRGPKFVTRKITLGVAECLKDPDFRLKLGNIKAKRDWSHAKDMVRGWWTMLQQPEPDDFVFGSGQMRSVEEFLEKAFSIVELDWQDKVDIDRFHMRPLEVDALCADTSKAKEILNWEPEISFDELVEEMVKSDCKLLGVGSENYK